MGRRHRKPRCHLDRRVRHGPLGVYSPDGSTVASGDTKSVRLWYVPR
ncbi:hypothetical protein [Streptomyces sp. IBSBF 2435]